jgi:hypothetical protein
VLQGIEPEVGEFGNLFPRRPDPEDATSVLRSQVLRVEFMSKPTIATSHTSSLRDAKGCPFQLPTGDAGIFAGVGGRRRRRNCDHEKQGDAEHGQQLLDHVSSLQK